MIMCIDTCTYTRTSNAVPPGEQGEAEDPVGESHDDAEDLKQVYDLIGYAVDPHNWYSKT